MDRKFLSIFIILIYVKKEIDFVIAVRKLNHPRDMSEYCRRRVAPSVFLGKQVMEAHSHIMHFSQLEVPYSCTLSVRAESGNDIILVIQLISELDLMESCTQNADQLVVYEFGETFGGYWGHLPDRMMKKATKNHSRFYTVKTTESTSITTTEQTTDYITDATQIVLTHKASVDTDRPKDFIRMEVPLVNVSGNFQLGSPLQTGDVEDMFDFIYDVTPKNGVEYETSVLPLVQFSIKKQGRPNSYGSEQRYDLDYAIEGVTLDSRLFTARSTSKRVKNRQFTKTLIPTLNSTSWKIEDVMKAYSMTTIRSTVENTSNKTIQKILQNISNMDHNISVYLAPNLTIYENSNPFSNGQNVKSTIKLEFATKISTTKNLHQVALSMDHNKIDNLLEDKKLTHIHITDNNNRSTLHTEFHVNNNSYSFSNNVHSIKTNKNVSNVNNSDSILGFSLQKGRMVDHESWENVVQAAPVMAVVLNRSEVLSNKSRKDAKRLTNDLRFVHFIILIDGRFYVLSFYFIASHRKKRNIHALEIENSRPRNLTTERALTTETETQYQFSDLQDLAELVELQDDEITGRLALRYIRNYVGLTLFNICDYHEAKARYVFLFNSSRIVIAINNFTLAGMTVVLTPAQALLSNTTLCDPGHLECQIVGTRVCIDSMNACDEVPNCGSYDIYDEDRLLCGITKELQHNVYLAAFTFLALILTLLYTIHYWLKRYVPRVADAFFVYTDATENTLFLDTIMRSPNEDDERSYKFAYPENLSDNDDLYKNAFKEDFSENFCKRIMRKCYYLLFCKKKPEEISSFEHEVYSSAPITHSSTFSFAEYELRKFKLREGGVQTGESLELHTEIHEEVKQEKFHQEIERDKQVQPKTISDINQEKHAEELKLIQFTKDSRSSNQSNLTFTEPKDLSVMTRRNAVVADDEKEIKSTVYERVSNININSEKIQVKCEVHTEKPKKQFDRRKLRFNEDLTMIPSEDAVDSTVVGGLSHQDLDVITEAGPEVSDSRDFMRFWGISKVKKGKKKKEKHLPTH
ncbi:uncharacterized protein LOC128199935 [Bicyclus anynana]|uniref:Uncharacterized protein LOC128199935 n=1 Tax=Bicyclus anynana TaxID=110368 RepID=A0ABM3M8W0_BICAN|nr:uncharacterized protein LOC128199935 [Bicyclus anynana]